jgi:hypothetical protein
LRALSRKHSEWSTWVDEQVDVLIDLIGDHRLLAGERGRKPRRICLVVDFYDIFEYLFPLKALIDHYQRYATDDAERSRVVADHIARAFMLNFAYAADEVLVLPPHARELHYSLLHVTTSRGLQDTIGNYLAGLREDRTDAVEELGERGGRSPARPSQTVRRTADVQHVFERLREQFSSLVLIIAGLRARSRDLLYMLLKDRLAIPKAGSLFYTEPSRKDVSFWQKKISNERSGEYEMASFRDAWVIAQIERINSDMKAGDQVYLLVSDADAVKNAIQEARTRKYIHIEGKNVTFLRTLDHFRTYLRYSPEGLPLQTLVAQGESRKFAEAVLPRLTEALAALRGHQHINALNQDAIDKCGRSLASRRKTTRVGDATGVCGKCPLSPLEPELRKSLEDIKSTQEKLFDCEALLRGRPYLKRYSQGVRESMSDFEEKALETLLGDNFREMADAFTASFRNRVTSQLIGLGAQIIAFKRKLTVRDFDRLIAFPFRIRPAAKALREQLSEMQALVAATLSGEGKATRAQLEVLQGAFEKLMSAAIKEGTEGDLHLVEALVLFSHGRHDSAARLCELEEQRAKGPLAAQFAYLRVRALLEYENDGSPTGDPLSACEQASQSYPRDPRFPLLASYALGERGIAQARDPATLNQAMAEAARGMQMCRTWDEIKAALANNLAYYTLQLGGDENLASARRVLEKMEESYGQGLGSWHAYWLDTRAHVFAQLAEREDDPGVRHALLWEAKQSLDLISQRAASQDVRERACQLLKRVHRDLGELASIAAVGTDSVVPE